MSKNHKEDKYSRENSLSRSTSRSRSRSRSRKFRYLHKSKTDYSRRGAEDNYKRYYSSQENNEKFYRRSRSPRLARNEARDFSAENNEGKHIINIIYLKVFYKFSQFFKSNSIFYNLFFRKRALHFKHLKAYKR